MAIYDKQKNYDNGYDYLYEHGLYDQDVYDEEADIIVEGLSKVKEVPAEFVKEAKRIYAAVSNKLGKFKTGILYSNKKLEDTIAWSTDMKRAERYLNKSRKTYHLMWSLVPLSTKISDQQIANVVTSALNGYEITPFSKGLKSLVQTIYKYKKLNEDCIITAKCYISYQSYTRMSLRIDLTCANNNEKTLRALNISED